MLFSILKLLFWICLGFSISYLEFPCAVHKLCLFVSKWFQVLFHSPLGGLFTFPSRYLFTIGQFEYLALDRDRPSFLQGLPCLVVLGIFAQGNILFRIRDCHALWLFFPEHFSTNCYSLLRPATPRLASWFRLLCFRSPLLTESHIVFFSSGYLDVSVPQVVLPDKSGIP